MPTLVTILLRLILLALGAGSLLAQALIPATAVDLGAQYPEVAHLVVPYAVAAILGFVCVEVALVAVWRLLSMVEGDRIFSVGSLRWVDTITVSAVVAAGLSAGVWAHLILVEQVGGPGALLGLGACVLAGVALALLMVVMRRLLTAATADRHELAEVI